METNHSVRLTSAEIASLWSANLSDSMANCILKYFLEKVEDVEVRSVIEYAMDITQNHFQKGTEILQQEEYPLPLGFTDEDLNLDAPRLFSDTYFLNYLKHMARVGLNANSLALPLSPRSDVKDFYTGCLTDNAELNNRVTDVLLSKGLYKRSPYISTPENVDFVKKQSFLGSLFGEQRQLLATEIGLLYGNLQTNALGKALTMGFSQVAKSQQVRKYMLRGKEIANKHIEIFRKIFVEDEIPSPTTFESDVTDSIVSPFSDKLMMFHISTLNVVGIADYGIALSLSMRRDLSTIYSRLMTEVGKYAEDGANIMIENGWMEEPPQAVDRKGLVQK